MDENLDKRCTILDGIGNSGNHVLDVVNDTHNLHNARLESGSTTYGSPFAPTYTETGKPSHRFHDWHATFNNKRALMELETTAAPEKILTLFALQLALLENLATTVGKLDFIWATVVLLGGFAMTLRVIDFWFVTWILVSEGARIFVRSRELEWQHKNPGKGTFLLAYNRESDAVHKSARIIGTVFSHLIMPQGSRSKPVSGDVSGYVHPVQLGRAWSLSKVSIVPFMSRRVFKAEHVSAILNYMQILSAVLSIVISVWRLSRTHEYDNMDDISTERNHKGAVIMFYGLTVFEALIFLVERAYWQFKITVKKILQTVNNSCRLKLDEDCYTVRCFFYDVYAKCLTESVFEGLKMDLVDYSLQWLQSDVPIEQLHGVKALLALSCHPESSQETLRTIGTRQGAVERLLEMVTWKSEEEQDMREAAASLLCTLVGYDWTSIRVAAISGSVEAIFSLLMDDSSNKSQSCVSHEYRSTEFNNKPDQNSRVSNRMHTGLKVLINMAKNSINCARIGSTKGLLASLISFIDTNKLQAGNEIAKGPEETVWFLSLELLSLLVASSGASGKILRQEIASNLVCITNLRDILDYKEGGHHLQELAVRTLSTLAMDADAREVIGRTGGLMQSLFSLFLTDAKGKEVNEAEMKVALKAGEALALLALQDSDNCARMVRLRLQADRFMEEEEPIEVFGNNMYASGSVNADQKKDVVDALMELLGDHQRGALAMFVLLCFFDNNVEWIYKMRIAAATSQVMRLAMVEDDERAQDAAIGLAARMLPFSGSEELERVFSSGECTKEDVAMMIIRKLEAHREPSTKLPWVRRVCLELVAALVNCDRASFWGVFASSERFISCLNNVAATSSDVENYVTFSGALGVALHVVTMEHLIQGVVNQLQLRCTMASASECHLS